MPINIYNIYIYIYACMYVLLEAVSVMGVLPRRLFIQADKTAKETKNKTAKETNND